MRRTTHALVGKNDPMRLAPIGTRLATALSLSCLSPTSLSSACLSSACLSSACLILAGAGLLVPLDAAQGRAISQPQTPALALAQKPAADAATAATREPTRPEHDPRHDIALSMGRGQLITLPETMKDVFVADDKVADVQVKSAREFYVFAKGGGTTTIYASDAAGRTIWSANLRVGANLDSVDHMIALAMPEAHITVTTLGTNTVLLTGAVANPEDAAEATRLVQAFMGKEANVITRLRAATPCQVNLQVRIAEVSRTLMRTLGSNIAAQGGTNGLIGVARGRAAGTITSPLPIGVSTGGSTAGLPVLDASAAYGLPTGSLSLPFNPATGKFIAPGNAGPAYAMAENLANTTAIGLAGHLFGLNVLNTLDVGWLPPWPNPTLPPFPARRRNFWRAANFPFPFPADLAPPASNTRNSASACPIRQRCWPMAAFPCGCGPRCPSCRPMARSRSTAIPSPRSPCAAPKPRWNSARAKAS